MSTLAEAAAGFTHAVLASLPLGQALDSAGADFAFDAWLLAALQQGWLASIDTRPFEAQETPPCDTPPTCQRP